jgi:hypothetical protein
VHNWCFLYNHAYLAFKISMVVKKQGGRVALKVRVWGVGFQDKIKLFCSRPDKQDG